VLPPTPPPDFDLQAWNRTIDEIERRKPNRLALVHFGVADDPGPHLAELRQRLTEWARRVEDGVTEDRFSESARSDLSAAGGDVETYERAMPFWQSYAGLKRYWDRQRAS
jgi:hypothetical protein